ncbi:MAG: hypothetical protein ACTSU5_12355 [Promethearchaeota archaeon]
MVKFAVLSPGQLFDTGDAPWEPDEGDLLEELRDMAAGPGGPEFAVGVENDKGEMLVIYLQPGTPWRLEYLDRQEVAPLEVEDWDEVERAVRSFLTNARQD